MHPSKCNFLIHITETDFFSPLATASLPASLFNSLICFSVSRDCDPVIHQFLKCRLSLVHSRDSFRFALLCYICTHFRSTPQQKKKGPHSPEIWTSSISTPDLGNVIFFFHFHDVVHPFFCCCLFRVAKKKNSKRAAQCESIHNSFPSSHISFNSTYCFIFTFFLILFPPFRFPSRLAYVEDEEKPLWKAFFLLILSSPHHNAQARSHATLTTFFFFFVFFPSCSHTLLSCFTLINK